MSKRRVTLKDIAKVAGVSAATVSHVLNNTAPISPETTSRVLKIVKDLNYEPNMVARNLANRSLEPSDLFPILLWAISYRI